MKKRVVILGAGESGTGAALLARSKGYETFVSDHGPIKEKYKNVLKETGIEFEESTHTIEKILNADRVIKSPGIAEKADIIKKVRAEGIEIIDEIEFAFENLIGKVIAITGTNGKTTTTLLTYHLLKTAGIPVALCGNIGESFARKVSVNPAGWFVLEVSSFQLDGIKSFKPLIGALLNITPDHLDRYDYRMQNYIDSKFRLIENMKSGDHFIYYADDPAIAAEVSKRKIGAHQIKVSLTTKTTVHFDDTKMEFSLDDKTFSIRPQETTLKGRHNLINTMAAVSAACLAGVNEESIRAGLKTFINAPHRLETIATINGVEFVNDSKATNVDSVVYALGSYHQPLIWIAGGIDKGNDYNLIKEEVRKKVKALICLGKDNAKLKSFFGPIVGRIEETQNVKSLVRMALGLAAGGDVVLLSPACASFDLFQNYEDRGNQFRQSVLELKSEMTAA